MGHITLNPKEEGKRGVGGAFAFLVGTVFELTLFPLGKGTKITEEGGCSGGMELKRLCNLPGKKRAPNSACEPGGGSAAARARGDTAPGDTYGSWGIHMAPGDTVPGDMAPGGLFYSPLHFITLRAVLDRWREAVMGTQIASVLSEIHFPFQL